MRKILLSTISALLVSGVLQAPSYADSSEVGKEILMFPVTMSSMAVGTVLGTPIAITRKSFDDTKETCNQVGGDHGPFVKGLGLLVALPVGVFTGTLKGLYFGPKNALYNSGEHPFSKDCFSLGEIGE